MLFLRNILNFVYRHRDSVHRNHFLFRRTAVFHKIIRCRAVLDIAFTTAHPHQHKDSRAQSDIDPIQNFLFHSRTSKSAAKVQQKNDICKFFIGKNVGKLQIGVFDADDGTDEVIRADVDSVVPVFVTRCDRIGFSFELGVETGHVGV